MPRMTNAPAPAPAPATAAAPIVPEPGQSLDLRPGANPASAVGAAAEKVEWTGKITLGPYEFDLVSTLSALDMVLLQEAQESKSLRVLMETVPRIVKKEQRQTLLDTILSDPDDEGQRVTMDDVLDALTNGLEQISNRPTDR